VRWRREGESERDRESWRERKKQREVGGEREKNIEGEKEGKRDRERMRERKKEKFEDRGVHCDAGPRNRRSATATHDICVRHVTHMNESCHTYERIMSHI